MENEQSGGNADTQSTRPPENGAETDSNDRKDG